MAEQVLFARIAVRSAASIMTLARRGVASKSARTAAVYGQSRDCLRVGSYPLHKALQAVYLMCSSKKA